MTSQAALTTASTCTAPKALLTGSMQGICVRHMLPSTPCMLPIAAAIGCSTTGADNVQDAAESEQVRFGSCQDAWQHPHRNTKTFVAHAG